MEWLIEIQNLITRESWSRTFDTDRISVGRNATNDLVIQNNFVSREHLFISNEKGSCYIADNQSANGTLIRRGGKYERLSDKSIVRLPVHLMVGSEISICVSSKAAAEGTTQTAIISRDEKQFLSQVISIKNLGRDEAIMVLDLCESTRMANKDDAMAFHIKRRLESISATALESHHVRFFKRTGDGFLASFPAATDALRAAREIIINLMERNQRTNNAPIHVRVALHKGKTYTIDSESGDVHGNDVNITFRLEGVTAAAFEKLENELPEKDRIVCSSVFADEIQGQPDLHVDCAYCGKAMLKGIDKPVDVFCIR
jgi:class 3 adenylate cyclase